MLAMAADLREQGGHQVTLVTGSVFRQQVEAAGVPFVPLTGAADFDYRILDQTFPGRTETPAGIERLKFDFINVLGGTIPEQYQTIQDILDKEDIDLIMVDTCFLGTFPLLLKPDVKRPPVLTCGVIPLFLARRPATISRSMSDFKRLFGPFRTTSIPSCSRSALAP
jgi:hypothetical protein